MNWEIVVDNSAKKQLRRILKKDAERILSAIEQTGMRIRTGNRRERIREQAEYTLEHHLKITSPKMRQVANLLRALIIALPGVTEKFGKSGIYYRTTKSFARLEFRPTWIQLLLKEAHYSGDAKKLIKDVTSNDWGYKGMIKLQPDSDIDYIFNLVKQSYESTL